MDPEATDPADNNITSTLITTLVIEI